MEGSTIAISLLFTVGLLLLVADIFLPSHGILTAASVAALMYAVYLTFQISNSAGFVSIVSLLLVVPTILVVAVKHWHRTPIGRRISPPNPTLTEQDRLPVVNLKELVGATGRSSTTLRPVGICVFNGQRIECTAESGMISANVLVEAVKIVDRTVVVRPVASEGQTV